MRFTQLNQGDDSIYNKIITIIIVVFIIVDVVIKNNSNLTGYAFNIENNVLNEVDAYRKYNYSSDKELKQSSNFVSFNKITIIAHRGANKFAPENSIPAIDMAGKMGYWGVELDVCSSSDGVLYLLHDGTLNRTTNGNGLITEKTSAQIDKLKIDKGSNISLYTALKIPRFEDALTECSKYNLIPVFDIKLLSQKERDINTLINTIYKHGYEKKVLIHSFNYNALEYLRSKNKEILVMPIIYTNDKAHGYEFAKSFGFTALDFSYSIITKETVQRAHKDGLKVFCWTIDNKADLDKAIKMGVDFIYSDDIYPNYNPIKS